MATKKASKKVIVKKPQVVLNPELAKLQIAELRMDMMHYIVESVAISILALLLFIGAPSVFPEIINPYLPSSLKIMQALVSIPLIFWLLTIFGNMFRYFKVLKLKDSIK